MLLKDAEIIPFRDKIKEKMMFKIFDLWQRTIILTMYWATFEEQENLHGESLVKSRYVSNLCVITTSNREQVVKTQEVCFLTINLNNYKQKIFWYTVPAFIQSFFSGWFTILFCMIYEIKLQRSCHYLCNFHCDPCWTSILQLQ